MGKTQNHKWVPAVDDYCIGCGKCIEACPHDCLKLVWDFATLTDTDSCISEGECTEVCRDGAIHMAWAHVEGDAKVGEWCDNPPKPAATGVMASLTDFFGGQQEFSPSPEAVPDSD